jgi:hypothetical protein
MSVTSNKPCSIESLAPKWRAEEIVTIEQHCMAAHKRSRREWTMAEIHIDAASMNCLTRIRVKVSLEKHLLVTSVGVPRKYLAFEQGLKSCSAEMEKQD